MKTKMIIAALLAMSTNAFAGVSIETRADYKSVTANDDAKTGAIAGYQYTYSTVQFNRAMLVYTSAPAGDVSFKFVANMLGITNPGATSAAGADSGLVDTGTLTYTFLPNFKFTLGKFGGAAGGFEPQEDAGKVHLTSYATGQATIGNYGGMSFNYVLMDDHSFYFQLFNEQTAATPGGAAAAQDAQQASRVYPNLAYHGKYLDKKLGFNFNYAQSKPGTANGNEKTATLMVAGVGYDFGVAKVALDYNSKVSGLGASVAGDNSTTGLVLMATVPVQNFDILVKVEPATENKTNGTKDFTYTRYSVGTNYKIAPDADLHVAYNSDTKKSEAASGATVGKSYTDTTFLFGMRMYADVLK